MYNATVKRLIVEQDVLVVNVKPDAMCSSAVEPARLERHERGRGGRLGL